MIQITIKLKPKWDLLSLTERYPTLTIYDWCNFTTDFYQVRTATDADWEEAVKAFLSLRKKLGFALQKRVEAGPNSNVFVMSCKHTRRGSIEQVMQNHSCMPVFPLVYHKGWLELRGICLDETKLPAMFARLERLGELRVEKRGRMNSNLLRENMLIPTSALVSGLTLKQAESLLAAVDFGYYNVPRKVRFEDIAGTMEVPRTTYEEHVRKAEGKVIGAVAPYLAIFFGKHPLNEQEDHRRV
ncbi:MAG: helix-turn-helix domain-containing protein [Nitrososphaerota archaeon]|jgi:hypothetical protein|nr:helix-turn-helix domain-containing protein [Nitrososphaerota archaeon]MDG6953038.1 helix-turn-helix domain-containing protein [Nitrososphaerota archaeon]MDG6959323.1 helix-turn-helix domain-containing protein [Nitrososphaerota archaeon]MDG6969172.1 helix-turn-helix domain-containing protein [Nitrososphaerota archaeon]MDG6971948.1 helix-turn-helix domain-containing protein [Nitrososphaerota archaeon]